MRRILSLTLSGTRELFYLLSPWVATVFICLVMYGILYFGELMRSTIE